MSRTKEILEEAQRELQGVSGGIVLLMIARRGLSLGLVEEWQRRLRAAADKLEELK